MRRMEANLRKARASRLRFSQSLASRRPDSAGCRGCSRGGFRRSTSGTSRKEKSRRHQGNHKRPSHFKRAFRAPPPTDSPDSRSLRTDTEARLSSRTGAFGISIQAVGLPELLSHALTTWSLGFDETRTVTPNKVQLENLDWQVLTIWECETEDAQALPRKLSSFLGS